MCVLNKLKNKIKGKRNSLSRSKKEQGQKANDASFDFLNRLRGWGKGKLFRGGGSIGYMKN